MAEAAPGLAARLGQSDPVPLAAEIACEPGQVLALLGPSGSGKTTVLRCIAGIHHPASGRVACRGELWLDTARGVRVAPQRRRVGLVFQHYALFPHLDALANVACAMTGTPRTARAGRARELLRLVNMEGLEDRRPRDLSGGQRQRVALARALARDPAVLLLDEPFAAVDQVTRRRLRRELARLRDHLNIPVVLVTHDLDEAQALADRIALLHHGRTLQSGPVAEVLRRPVSAEAARLLDQRNLFRARVLGHDAEPPRTWIEWAGHRLECAPRPDIAPGTAVDWMVPRSAVVLHRRDRPSRGEHENPVRGTVAEMVVLGDDAYVTVAVPGAEEPVALAVSVHVARRNRVAAGEPIGVSLLAEGIHLMPRVG